MAIRWLRDDAWSRIEARAHAIDSEFGAGGNWYRRLAFDIIDRTRSSGRSDAQGPHLDGICYAANTISAMLSPVTRPASSDEMDFLKEYVDLRDRERPAVAAARRLLKYNFDAVLPPKRGLREIVLPGLHVPAHFSQPAARIIYDEPELIVGAGAGLPDVGGQYPAFGVAAVVNLDVAAGKIWVAGPGGRAEGAVGSIEWEPSEARAWVEGLATSSYEAIQVTGHGIDVFDRSIDPLRTEARAYRFDGTVSDAAAEAIGHGFFRYQADLKHGIVDQPSLSRAIDASQVAIASQPPDVRAGAAEMIEVLGLGKAQIPGAAARAVLNAVAEDLFEDPSPVPVIHTPSATAGRDLPGPAGEERVLEVQSTGSLAEREVTIFATVTPADLTRPLSSTSRPFPVDLAQPVIISSSAEGFVTDDQTWVQVQLEPGKRSPTVAFRFSVLPTASRYAITVRVHQLDAELGRVTISKFDKPRPVTVPLDKDPCSVDVSISLDDRGVIRLFTADGTYRALALDAPDTKSETARELVDRFVKTAVGVADESPDKVEQGLLELALDVKNALPVTLIEYLERTENLNVIIDYPAECSFPFELALLESADGDPRLLGEVHNVSRWPSCASRSPRYQPRKIGRAAFVSDPESLSESAAEVEIHRAALRKVCQTDDYCDLPTIRKNVFRATTFELVDFVTHMRGKKGQVGLTFGGELLRPNAFFKPDRQFGTAAALVFVNACSSILADAHYYSRKSFPQQFIDFQIPAVVASVLPVEPDLALRFGNFFYTALDDGHSLANAVRRARRALVADDVTDVGPERRRLAAAAYCVFGHPMMTINFER